MVSIFHISDCIILIPARHKEPKVNDEKMRRISSYNIKLLFNVV